MSPAGGSVRRGLPGVAPSTDRRFRRSDAPVDRRRRLTRTVWRSVRWMFPASLVVGALVWGGVAVAGSAAFRIRDVVVTGNERLTATEIQSLAAGLRGENLLQVDLAHYAAQIRESAWVADVLIFRVLPATVEIRIRERHPIAIARHDQRLYLVDDTGIIIDEYQPAYRAYDLPVIDGLVTSAPGGELLADPERVRLADALLTAFRGRPDLLTRLSQIDVSTGRDARVLFDDDPAWLHLGQEAFGERLGRYLELRPTLRNRFNEIDYVDLRFGERIYVQGRPDRQAGRGR
jgi:cell division septal protein FtsQ